MFAHGIAARLSQIAFYSSKFAPEIAPESVEHKHTAHPNSFYLIDSIIKFWSERRDLNPRPLHPQYSALPGCATLRPALVIAAPRYLGNQLFSKSDKV